MTPPSRFRPYQPTAAEAAALLAAGWRRVGDVWAPPYPDNYTYTYRAAALQHAADLAEAQQRHYKPRSVIPLEPQP